MSSNIIAEKPPQTTLGASWLPFFCQCCNGVVPLTTLGRLAQMRRPHLMAKILMTAIVADIRNKLNGSVFSKNRYGAYVRTKVTPVNPKTAAQTAQRSSFAANAQAWRGLTEAQRLSWAAAAPNFPVTDIFGNPKILSPSALYSKLNGNLASIGVAALASAPALVAVGVVDITLLTADQSVPDMTVQALPINVPVGFRMVIRATGTIGAGQSFVKNKFRIIAVFPANASTSVNIYSEWSAKFGLLTVGTKIFVEFYLVSITSGQAGIASQLSTIVVA